MNLLTACIICSTPGCSIGKWPAPSRMTQLFSQANRLKKGSEMGNGVIGSISG
ncbi:hypothetical protein [Paenibacillus sedimenti]|uniref:hypothetical protein n=1 Tax=Paenibacillus sedimenti TaxID=2770274 RepID=UPI001CB7008B|nr:hypothetical protein [Paenibacillus sedimenti]